MPSISATLQISSSGLADLQAIPQQLESLVNGAQSNLSSIHTGAAAGNPFSALLGNFQGLAGQTANLPDLGPVLAPVQSLAKDLPDAGFASIDHLTRGVDEMLGVFGPVKDLLLAGKLNLTLEQGAQKAVDVVGGLLKPGDDSVPILGQLEQFFEMFRSLQSWDQTTPSAQALADLLGQLFVGVPADLLQKPYSALRAVLDPLSHVLPEGPELTAWRGAFQGRSQFWAQANTQLAVSNINWSGLETSLHGELQLLIDLRAKRDRLISVSLSNLTSLNFRGLDQLNGAISAIARPPEFRIAKIMDGIRSHIESLATSLESWAPTPEELQGLVNGLTGSFRAFLEESPLGELRAMLLRFHHRLMVAIESLPFRDLAAKVEKALLQVAKAIDIVDPDLIRKPIHEFFDKIDSKIKEIPLADIQQAINAVWQSVRDVFQQINTQLEDLKNTLTGLVGHVKDLMQQIQPTLDSVSEGVNTIKTQLESFDLKEPASVIIDDLHELRDKLAAVDFSKIPGPALSGLHVGAQLLRGLDVAGAVNPPLNDALAKVDPTPQLQSVTATLSSATANLRAIDPSNVVKQLDKPVDELLKVLNEFGPEKLKGLLLEAIRPIEDALHQLDFAHVLSPVTKLFADLFAKVDAVLNPDVIFAPLDKLVQPVVDAIDAVKPSSLIALATSHAGSISEATASAAHPPAAINNARAALQSIPEAAETKEKLFGYRPGDLLLPVIDIYRLFMQAVDRASEEVLGQAAQAFQHNLTGRLRALLPASIGLEVEGGLQAAIGEFHPSLITRKLDDSALAFQSFVAKFTALSANLNPADAVVAGRIGNLLGQLDPLLLTPSPAQSEGLMAASAQAKAGVHLDGIQNVASQLIALESMFPAFLQAPQVTAASLRQFLKDLDPSPIRIAINTAYDRIGKRIVALQEPLMKGLDQLMGQVEDFVLPITPGALLGLADRLHQAVKDQLLAFHPDRFKDELKLVFDIVKAQLKAFDPAILVDELNHQRDVLIQTLRDFVTQIQPDLSEFVKLQQDLAALKPSEILKPAVESLKPVADLLGKIDVKIILEPLIDAIAKVRAQVPEVVAEIEAALDEVLNAIPEGGGASVSVSASVSAA
jgi:hypothetical protein